MLKDSSYYDGLCNGPSFAVLNMLKVSESVLHVNASGAGIVTRSCPIYAVCRVLDDLVDAGLPSFLRGHFRDWCAEVAANTGLGFCGSTGSDVRIKP